MTYIWLLSLLLLNTYAPSLIRKVNFRTVLSQFLQYLLSLFIREMVLRSGPGPRTLSSSALFLLHSVTVTNVLGVTWCTERLGLCGTIWPYDGQLTETYRKNIYIVVFD